MSNACWAGIRVDRHQDALGLLDLRAVLGEIGDRRVNGEILAEIAEVDVEALTADNGAVVAELLADDEHVADAARRVDDAVPAAERLTAARHRLDQE